MRNHRPLQYRRQAAGQPDAEKGTRFDGYGMPQSNQGPPGIARQADILVAAIGRANFVTADMVKPGAVVIDVGINRVDDATRERGYRLVGDVDFDAVEPIASHITPVPGGVGPMTIAVLLQNTLRAATGK